jgi:hypothetical protein
MRECLRSVIGVPSDRTVIKTQREGRKEKEGGRKRRELGTINAPHRETQVRSSTNIHRVMLSVERRLKIGMHTDHNYSYIKTAQ